MQTYILFSSLKQFCHLSLGEPDGFILQSHIQFECFIRLI